MKYDVIVIGAGAVGAFVSRELSKYNLDVLVIDKENDVGNVTSMANSAIVHSGYDPLPGTLKAKFNVLGNAMFDEIRDNLDVPVIRNGSLTVALYDEQLPLLEELKKRSALNGVEVRLLNKEETLAIEPNLSPEVKGSLLAPTAGIVDPFLLVVRAMENAVDNGVHLELNQEVINITHDDENDIFNIITKTNTYQGKVVVNSAGLYSGAIARMIEDIDWDITPRKGQYFVLDHFDNHLVEHVIFPLPSEKGKGILVSRTTSENVIVGPSSEPIDNPDDLSTDGLTLKNIKASALNMVPSIPFNKAIRAFSGNRATCTRHDFVIESSKKYPTFINLGGIESPGLVSSPAIGKYVVEEMIANLLRLEKKDNYNPSVKKRHKLKDLSSEERDALIKENPLYGKIVCFCEGVSLGEVVDELNRSVPPHSIKAMKKRVRAGFGKCQGGFCQPHILEELAKYYDTDWLDINYDNLETPILKEKVK